MEQSSIKVFKGQFGEIRTVLVNGAPWFVGKDVAEALGYKDVKHSILDHVDDEDRVNSKTQGQNDPEFGQRGTWLINESGIYSLVLSSKLPTAKKFKRWITSEVIPTIRKYGTYMTERTIEKALTSPDFIIQLATKLKEEQEERRRLEVKTMTQQTVIEEMQPKAVFADAVSVSKNSILIRELAKLMRQNGIEIGEKSLFEWMRTNGYLIRKSGSDYNSTTQKSMDLGLFEVKETAITHASGEVTTKRTPKVTGKGQLYFLNKFIEQCNVQ